MRLKLKKAIPIEEPKECAECMEKHLGANATVHFQSQCPLGQMQALGQNADAPCSRPASASLGQANGEQGFMDYMGYKVGDGTAGKLDSTVNPPQ